LLREQGAALMADPGSAFQGAVSAPAGAASNLLKSLYFALVLGRRELVGDDAEPNFVLNLIRNRAV
jgi:hypothetical protein